MNPLARHINLMFAPAQAVMPNLQGGKPGALAVASARRSLAAHGCRQI